MTDEEQASEIAAVISMNNHSISHGDCYDIATAIMDKGYRKNAETLARATEKFRQEAEEIKRQTAKEIIAELHTLERRYPLNEAHFAANLAEKYGVQIEDIQTARCRSCGKEIVWITTKEGGKKMPCDYPQVEYRLDKFGKCKIVTMTGDVVRGEIVTRKIGSPLYALADGVGYTSHFATCPQADKWRRG